MGRLPNVIVPGAQKSGTTSLVRALEGHPQCALARPKEPSFFCRASDLGESARYEAAFAHVTRERRIIDASTAYMVDPAVPGRVRALLGEELHIVFILRDPAERALSAYWHLAKRGAERRTPQQVFALEAEDLEEAAEQESQRLASAVAAGLVDPGPFAKRYDDALWPFRYLENGSYLEAIRRWQETFGSQRVMALLLEEWAADSTRVLRRLADFLGLEPEWPGVDPRAVHNRTRVPRAGAFARGLRALGGRPALRALRARVPRARRWYERALYGPPPAASPELRERLRGLYAPLQVELAAHLGRDLAPWWGRSAQPPTSSAA